jgi:hypothetical protein
VAWKTLFASSLMPSLGEQFFVLVLTHLFSAFFDDATQSITSPHSLAAC